MSAKDYYDLAPKREKMNTRLGEMLTFKFIMHLNVAGKTLKKISIRWEEWETFLVVVVENKADHSEQVAFHTGETLGGALLSFSTKVRRDEVKWKPNKKWEPK